MATVLVRPGLTRLFFCMAAMSGSHGLEGADLLKQNGFLRLSNTAGEFLSPAEIKYKFYKCQVW